MTCFCGCDDFEKNPNGQFLACVKCGHGHQIMMINLENLQEQMKSSHKSVMLTSVNFSFKLL